MYWSMLLPINAISRLFAPLSDHPHCVYRTLFLLSISLCTQYWQFDSDLKLTRTILKRVYKTVCTHDTDLCGWQRAIGLVYQQQTAKRKPTLTHMHTTHISYLLSSQFCPMKWNFTHPTKNNGYILYIYYTYGCVRVMRAWYVRYCLTLCVLSMYPLDIPQKRIIFILI